MIIRCIWEHNGSDTLLYADNFIGAFTRGESKEIALGKMPDEVNSYLKWRGEPLPELLVPEIIEEKESDLNISDADSDVIFDSEKPPLTKEEYFELKALALKSAEDFLKLYNSIPDKDKTCLHRRNTFYGEIPATAKEMYEHTKNVNSYYFGEIGIEADNCGTILECRQRGFELLEKQAGYLDNKVFEGSYDELWSLRKVLRRFIWHDRIHAKAMYRMAASTFSKGSIVNAFEFSERKTKLKKVIVTPYDPQWKDRFAFLKQRIENAIGDIAIAIEHVGSTSVEGLSAKPIIDLDVVIEDDSALNQTIKLLSEIGYIYEGDKGIKDREAFDYTGNEPLPKHHLYVCSQNSKELARHIAFRDFLRKNSEAVAEYSRVKEEAARLYPNDIDGYMQYKSPCVEKFYAEIFKENEK